MKKKIKDTVQKNIQFQNPDAKGGRSSYSVYLDLKTFDRINEVIEKRFFGCLSDHQMMKLAICIYLYGSNNYQYSDSILVHRDFKSELTNDRNKNKTSSRIITKMISKGLRFFEG